MHNIRDVRIQHSYFEHVFGRAFLIPKNERMSFTFTIDRGNFNDTQMVNSAFYKLIKLDPSFIKQSDTGQSIALKGQVGMIDGIPFIVLPASYMPTGVDFFVTNKIATTAPVKLTEYKVHDNPPGINDWLVEGRLYHDAFVLDNRKKYTFVKSIRKNMKENK